MTLDTSFVLILNWVFPLSLPVSLSPSRSPQCLPLCSSLSPSFFLSLFLLSLPHPLSPKVHSLFSIPVPLTSLSPLTHFYLPLSPHSLLLISLPSPLSLPPSLLCLYFFIWSHWSKLMGLVVSRKKPVVAIIFRANNRFNLKRSSWWGCRLRRCWHRRRRHRRRRRRRRRRH